jgi:hypothetical protein
LPIQRPIAISSTPVGISAKTREHRIVRRLAVALGLVIVGAVIGLGCSHAGVFRCESSGQCQDGELQGVCTDAGYCAFDDESCASGLEYGALADPELAGTCVPVDDGTGSSDELGSDSTTTSSTSSSEGPPVTSDETGHEVVCPQGLGGPCEPEDPCALAGICDPDGICVPTEVVTCNEPPGPCDSLPGECRPDGGCTYQTVPPGDECQDGDPCTVGDWCDDAGECVPGQACPQGDECQTVECTKEGCSYSAAPDGTPCGEGAANRCCGGACVDISSDTLHCGGCNTECFKGQECESVEVTAMCPDSPAATSGRCRCELSDDQCPLGQLCRTQAPYTGRCAPSSAMSCDGAFVEVQLCPNYCSY